MGVPAQIIGLDPSSPFAETKLEGKNYRLSADLTGSIGEWDTATALTLSRNNLLNRIIGSQNADYMGAALNRASNPYSITGTNTATDIAGSYPDNRANLRSELGQLEFHATKSLMQLEGGDLGFSAGGSYLFTRIDSPPPSQQATASLPGYNPGQFVEGEQSDTALFAEVAAPLTKVFELDGHVRYDHFALSGNNNSFTPAAGFKWSPTQSFALRGTLATGFRAPNVAETGKSGLVFAGGNDTLLCPDSANPAPGTPVASCLSTPVFQSGYNVKPKLNPEKSVSATLGVILEPIKGWSSTVDLYDIKIKNQIYTPPPSVANVSVRSQTPISGLCYQATGTAPCVTPGGANGILLYELAPYENTNNTEVRGFELETHYKWKMGDAGSLIPSFDWSHTMSYILKVGGTNYQLAGTHGPELIGGDTANPKDRIQAKLTWDKGPWDVTVVENYISGYDNRDPSYVGSLANPLANTCTNNLNVYSGVQFLGYAGGVSSYPSSYCQTSSFTTTDLTIQYTFSKQLVVHLAANNLFNRQPPFDAATYGGSPYLYNPSLHFGGAVGRFVQAGVSYSF
ncbi:outer membrane receptor protein involved in Fe transport [Oxalobacteraceae bacterium GrIS 2.11]